jgi:hypothetical protein
LALERLPTAEDAERDPEAAAETVLRLASEHPRDKIGSEGEILENGDAVAGAVGVGKGGGGGGATGAAAFLDALAAFRFWVLETARAGSGVANGLPASDAIRAELVNSPSTRANARRAGNALVALLSHASGPAHLWREVAFLAIPLLEGTHRALTPSAAQTVMARLERFSMDRYAGKMDRSALEAEAATRGTRAASDVREYAARLAIAREYARACVTR